MLDQVEWNIARLIADDLSDTEIAHQLRMPEDAVVRHLLHIFYKCKVASRLELSAYLRRTNASMD